MTALAISAELLVYTTVSINTLGIFLPLFSRKHFKSAYTTSHIPLNGCPSPDELLTALVLCCNCKQCCRLCFMAPYTYRLFNSKFYSLARLLFNFCLNPTHSASQFQRLQHSLTIIRTQTFLHWCCIFYVLICVHFLCRCLPWDLCLK